MASVGVPGEDLTRLPPGSNVLWNSPSLSGATMDEEEPSDADRSLRARPMGSEALSSRELASTTRHSERGTRMRVGIRRFLSAAHNARHARVPVTLVTLAAWLAVVFALATGAGAGGTVGTSFP